MFRMKARKLWRGGSQKGEKDVVGKAENREGQCGWKARKLETSEKGCKRKVVVAWEGEGEFEKNKVNFIKDRCIWF